MKRFLLLLVVVIAASFAIAQYKITSTVADGLDHIKRSIAPVIRMEYGGVSTSLFGKIEVTDLKLVSLRDNQEIVAEKLALDAGSPWVLLSLQENLSQNRIPEQLEFSVEGLLADMEFMTNLQNTTGTDSPFTRLETAGCNGRSGFSRRDLSDMGIDRLVLDWSLGYQLTHGGMGIHLTNRMRFRDQMTVNLDMEVSHPDPINVAGLSAELISSSSLSSASIAIEDHGQLDRMLELCARETDMTVAEYQKHHLEAWVAEWQNMELAPSDTLISAYRDYINHPGSSLTVDLEPFPALALGDNYLSPDPVYLSGRLNPKMGTERTGMQPVSVAEAEQSNATVDKPDTPESPNVAAASAKSAAPTGTKPGSPTGISAYLQRDVAITLKNGRRMEGTIVAIEGQALKLRRHMHGGSMVVPVQISEIQAVARY